MRFGGAGGNDDGGQVEDEGAGPGKSRPEGILRRGSS